jgi:solute:Na+ symporter, SSS family
MLQTIDWLIIALYFLVALGISFYYRNKASNSATDFFLGGRNLPWLVAGISMVATTFAADTPLAVTELVVKNGVSGNWLWWNMLMGGMLTTFFFARLWHRANILTELEFIELRYNGKPAAWLRGFKAIYLGLFMNALVIGWVNVAMNTILSVFFDIPESEVYKYTAAAMLITVFYSGLSGLWGVAVTDAVQFVIAITGCIILAVIVLQQPEVGGMAGLIDKVPESALSFFPVLGDSATENTGTLVITIGAFLSFVGVQWWSSWYPGAEPGGGGYVVQRMMSTRNEKSAQMATLLFQIAHYCLRPWPWIIVALCTLVLYPGEANPKAAYVMAMKDYLPAGLKGLMLVAFLAAYMSTISTQINWGASYLVNDFYQRFIRPASDNVSAKHYVKAARWSMGIIMLAGLLATSQITSISSVWEFIMECGAGLGLVLILRWYWWRINAWSEIAATVSPFVAYAISKLWLEDYFGDVFIAQRGTFFFTVGVTTVVWLAVTFLTKPEENQHLQRFFERVQPPGWWKPFNARGSSDGTMTKLLAQWFLAVLLTYSVLFATGKLLFHQWQTGLIWVLITLISGLLLVRLMIPSGKENRVG